MPVRVWALMMLSAALGLSLFAPPEAESRLSARQLYIQQCAECHHPGRLGLSGPPLIPGLFSRGARGRLEAVIRDGLPATQMPGYAAQLAPEQIAALAKYIAAPVDEASLRWDAANIAASREEAAPGAVTDSNPVQFENVTLVMERGTKSLVVLDGERLERRATFYVGAVHGGPKFSHSIEEVYAVARDGLVTKFNLRRLAVEVRLKAGISSRSIAVSGDDQIVAVANYLPRNVVFFNQRLEILHTIDLPGRVGGFYTLRNSNRFILSFRERPEMWIIKAGGAFGVEKLKLPAPFEDFSISPVGPYLLGTKRGSDRMFIYDLDKKEVLASLPTSGLPHLASAAFWISDGELFAGVNHIKKPMATILSLGKRTIVAEAALPGAGFFVRTHSATPYLWIDTETEKIALVDKSDFSIVRYLTPHKGRKAMHVEFTKPGRHALVTIPGENGEVVVYDTVTLKKIGAVPFNRPVGKYNATNKTYPEKAMGAGLAMMAGASGEDVFDNYCMGCHHQMYEAFAPPFTEIADMRSEKEIRAHIAAPHYSAESLGYVRSSMSTIRLTNDQIDAVVSYILSFKGKN